MRVPSDWPESARNRRGGSGRYRPELAGTGRNRPAPTGRNQPEAVVDI